MNFSAASPSRQPTWLFARRVEITARGIARWNPGSVKAGGATRGDDALASRLVLVVLSCLAARHTAWIRKQAVACIKHSSGRPRSEWSLGTLESKQRLPSCQLFSLGLEIHFDPREHLARASDRIEPILSAYFCPPPLNPPSMSTLLIGTDVRTFVRSLFPASACM